MGLFDFLNKTDAAKPAQPKHDPKAPKPPKTKKTNTAPALTEDDSATTLRRSRFYNGPRRAVQPIEAYPQTAVPPSPLFETEPETQTECAWEDSQPLDNHTETYVPELAQPETLFSPATEIPLPETAWEMLEQPQTGESDASVEPVYWDDTDIEAAASRLEQLADVDADTYLFADTPATDELTDLSGSFPPLDEDLNDFLGTQTTPVAHNPMVDDTPADIALDAPSLWETYIPAADLAWETDAAISGDVDTVLTEESPSYWGESEPFTPNEQPTYWGEPEPTEATALTDNTAVPPVDLDRPTWEDTTPETSPSASSTPTDDFDFGIPLTAATAAPTPQVQLDEMWLGDFGGTPTPQTPLETDFGLPTPVQVTAALPQDSWDTQTTEPLNEEALVITVMDDTRLENHPLELALEAGESLTAEEAATLDLSAWEDDSLAIANTTETWKDDSLAIANTTETWKDDSLAIANTTETWEDDSLAITNTTETWEDDSVAIANTTEAWEDDSLAIANTTETWEDDSVAIANTTETWDTPDETITYLDTPLEDPLAEPLSELFDARLHVAPQPETIQTGADIVSSTYEPMDWDAIAAAIPEDAFTIASHTNNLDDSLPLSLSPEPATEIDDELDSEAPLDETSDEVHDEAWDGLLLDDTELPAEDLTFPTDGIENPPLADDRTVVSDSPLDEHGLNAFDSFEAFDAFGYDPMTTTAPPETWAPPLSNRPVTPDSILAGMMALANESPASRMDDGLNAIYPAEHPLFDNFPIPSVPLQAHTTPPLHQNPQTTAYTGVPQQHTRDHTPAQPAMALQQPSPPSSASDDGTEGDFDILDTIPLSPTQRLYLVNMEGLIAVMGEWDPEITPVDGESEVAVLKVFDQPPFSSGQRRATFMVSQDTPTAGREIYTLTVGSWRGIITLAENTITLKADLGTV